MTQQVHSSGSTSHITSALDQGILTIRLSRPDQLNSLNRPMLMALYELFSRAAHRNEVRCVLLTAEGRGFCAGQDLTEVLEDRSSPPDLGRQVAQFYNPLILAIRSLEKPVVAAINGVAAGAGASLALHCDFVIAAKSAFFVQAFSKIGLIPDSGGSFLLPRLVGLARATALTMLGDKLSASEAQTLGLIHAVVDDDTLIKEAESLAGRLALMPTRALGLTKRALNAAFSNTLEDQLSLEEDLQRSAGHTSDYQEGIKAFIEKRAPRFTGK